MDAKINTALNDVIKSINNIPDLEVEYIKPQGTIKNDRTREIKKAIIAVDILKSQLKKLLVAN